MNFEATSCILPVHHSTLEEHILSNTLVFWIIFKYALILQSDLQNRVVIKMYIARLISLHASCVFYVTRQVYLKINLLSHARSWKYGKYSTSAYVQYPTLPSASLDIGRRGAIFFRIPLIPIQPINRYAHNCPRTGKITFS